MMHLERCSASRIALCSVGWPPHSILKVFWYCLVIETQPIACNINAISAGQRPHYSELTLKLRASIRARMELPDGYAFRLDGHTISLTDVADWIQLERVCCPFLVFQLQIKGADTEFELALRGPSGAKAILDSAFSK